MRKLTTIVLAILSIVSYGQEATYGDLYGYSSLSFHQTPDDLIKCEDFFANYDTAMENLEYYIQECSPKGPINRSQVYPEITKYPDEAKPYKVSGSALIDFLVDKEGNLVCYRIRTELGDAFIKQIEKNIPDYKFEKFTCQDESFAYVTITGFVFKYKKKYRKNRP